MNRVLSLLPMANLILRRISNSLIAVLFVCSWIALLSSRAALSITMGLITIVGLAIPKQGWLHKRETLRSDFAWIAVMGWFLVLLPSVFYSGDHPFYWETIRIRLPFLILPLAIAGTQITRLLYLAVWYFFVLVCTLAAIGVLINYAFHFDAITEQLHRSGYVPTPVHHVRFSLLLALAVIAGFVLFQRRFYIRWPAERFIMGGCALFLVIAIHILSVRSGLVALYIAALAVGIQTLVARIRTGLWWHKLLAVLLFVSVVVSCPVLAYRYLPSFEAKVALTMYNIQQYNQGQVGELSDARRMVSYKVAWDIAQRHPVWGTGMGYFRDSVTTVYNQQYPSLKPTLPHNQFLYTWASSGIIGLVLFVLCCAVPLFARKRIKDPLFLGFYTIAIVSMMVEYTLETQIGVAFIILPLTWLMVSDQDNK